MSANESKRRSEPKPIDKTASFQYQPLEKGVDCTRFLSIHPAKNDSDPTISCALNHIAFGEKPSYEALSYRWGEEAPVHTIVLNGHPFLVRKNLRDALLYLQNRGNGGLLWVDAICIDQANVQERNRQVAIMRHIYFRARTVVVWLGSTYSQFQEGMGPLEARFAPEESSMDESPTTATESGEANDEHATNLECEREMVLRLAKDEYWNRVWIIQEIGHARQRRVCFGNMELSWGNFIRMMTHHSVTNEGPLRLNQQVEQKYQGSHTLRRLLHDHQKSRCQDPKDKIFGLIGLAVDGNGYPSPDYDKSVIQIWTETMEFMNSRSMFDDENELDILSLANLVKFLLMGTRSTPIQQILRPYVAEPERQLISLQYGYIHPHAFKLTGYLLGTIRSLGPSVKDVAGNLDKVDEWSHGVQTNYGDDLGNACRQSDDLIGAILNKEDRVIGQMCFNQSSLVIWEDRIDRNYPVSNLLYWMEQNKHILGSPGSSSSHPDHSSYDITEDSQGSETLLYQLQTGRHSDQSPEWKMGVVPSKAALGDIVCWVGGTKTALLVRPTGRREVDRSTESYARFQVIGTAMIAEDIADSTIDHHRRLNIQGVSGLGRYKQETKLTGKLSLILDARTLYIILLGSQHCAGR
ncbi:HET domain-containing protein [Colletotrichum limetticola]|uniref:HET domain-containing protein n=1 Tax=Colletotrichum limetticola TaxID=1209924 RepID=A0ABQ9PI91_9PEZI|nr:HET domain-containing protein [Colletotrichum limetticola]